MNLFLIILLFTLLTGPAHAQTPGGVVAYGPAYSSDIMRMRNMVAGYSAALKSYDARRQAEYVIWEAKFRESQEINNLSAENAKILDAIREMMREELAKARAYLEQGGDQRAAHKMIDAANQKYRTREAELIKNGAMIVTQSVVLNDSSR